jgi:hypothetical protein
MNQHEVESIGEPVNLVIALRVLLSGLCLLVLLGCEVKTSATLGNGPSFALDGSGHLASFTVYAPQPGRRIATPNDSKSEVWSIRPASGRGEMVARMNLIYGRVPDGYVQAVPVKGTAPSLAPGLVYYFFAETTGAPGAEGFFYMDKSNPVLINVPGLCESAFVGDVKPVKCGTSDPYVEPKDLEKFVQENRIQK